MKPPPPPPRCGNCSTTLLSDGTCENCDRRPARVTWWELLDVDWLVEMERLDNLDVDGLHAAAAAD